LTTADEQEKEKLEYNLRYLSTGMASYGLKKASIINSAEGQLLLNRYYTAMKQLGVNVSTQIKHVHDNTALIDEFLADVQKIRQYEQDVFNYYKVNSKTFAESKS
jgi:hypothetical protein